MRDELVLLREARPDAVGPSPELARETRRRLMTDIALEGSRRRKFQKRAALLLAATTAAAAVALVGVTSLDRSDGTAWAAALVRVAETAPRLLVDAPGWTVARADEFGVDYGEMTFSNGKRRLDLKWVRGTDLGATLGDPHSGVEPLGTTTVAGAHARLFRYEDSNDFFAVWSQGGYGIQARGLAADLATFTAVILTLHEVGVETWLSAMPQSIVKPDSRNKVVLEMLEDVPLPPGYDVAQLLHARTGAVHDRYQLGAEVAGTVACSWLERWVAARHKGDYRVVRQTVRALATSHHWRLLHEMKAKGDYPRVLWQYADAAATDVPINAGKQLTVAASYRRALGCDT